MKTKMILVQTTVTPTVLLKLDALARATQRKRAQYLRRLIGIHVNATSPKLETVLSKVQES